jgi:hypothetical protein
MKFNIILSLRFSLSSDLFPSGFPSNILYAFLFSAIRATCPTNLILLDLIIIIILGEKCKLWISNYAVFPILLPFHPSSAQTFSSAPCSQTPSVCVLPSISDTNQSPLNEQICTCTFWRLEGGAWVETNQSVKLQEGPEMQFVKNKVWSRGWLEINRRGATRRQVRDRPPVKTSPVLLVKNIFRWKYYKWPQQMKWSI